MIDIYIFMLTKKKKKSIIQSIPENENYIGLVDAVCQY